MLWSIQSKFKMSGAGHPLGIINNIKNIIVMLVVDLDDDHHHHRPHIRRWWEISVQRRNRMFPTLFWNRRPRITPSNEGISALAASTENPAQFMWSDMNFWDGWTLTYNTARGPRLWVTANIKCWHSGWCRILKYPHSQKVKWGSWWSSYVVGSKQSFEGAARCGISLMILWLWSSVTRDVNHHYLPHIRRWWRVST